jgi:hypothetical protein
LFPAALASPCTTHRAKYIILHLKYVPVKDKSRTDIYIQDIYIYLKITKFEFISISISISKI